MQPIVTVERFIAASPERLYAALTQASELRQWFFSEARTDPRVGGEYQICWRSRNDPTRDHDRFGRYLELVPNRRVVFEWKGNPQQKLGLRDIGTTVVTVTLEPESGGTRVRLVHAGWPASEAGSAAADSHNGGWTFYIDNLASVLTGGPDLREQHFDQSTKHACAG